ncbi:2'-5' RNA ligase family protein [Egbenema bharatensis]|uniref:2'-5' RNA ligase family protein n=1 Tax=Egbenema bharatensis TaxID=3463334 RepID=UPI003A886100
MVPPDVQEYAQQVIAELKADYQTDTAKVSPHITLQAPFLWQPEQLPELESCIRAIAQVHSEIPIAVSNFGAFAPRVLYLDVHKTAELLALQSRLAEHLEATLGIVDLKAKTRSFSPHITVASRNLKRKTFQQAWARLQERQVEFNFICDRLTLLRHDGARWQTATEFPFVKIL